MISKSLTRRLEDLESRYQPIGDREPRVYCIEYVDSDSNVVDRIQLKRPRGLRTPPASERDHSDGVADNAVYRAGLQC
jgi:hypothetical protein